MDAGVGTGVGAGVGSGGGATGAGGVGVGVISGGVVAAGAGGITLIASVPAIGVLVALADATGAPPILTLAAALVPEEEEVDVAVTATFEPAPLADAAAVPALPAAAENAFAAAPFVLGRSIADR